MNEEVDEIIEKFERHEETIEDAYRLKAYADQGDTKAALNYGICLFVGHLVVEDKDEASKYLEKVYMSGRIEELNELASFYQGQGPAYENMCYMVVDKALDMFRTMSFQEQFDFFMKHVDMDKLKEMMDMSAVHKDF